MQKNTRTKFRAWQIWLAVVLVLAVIFGLSAQADSAQMTAEVFGAHNFAARKAAHILEFAFLWIMLRTATALSFRRLRGLPADLLCLLATGVFAALDEWHQSFVPGRTACALDVLWDMGGALLVWLVWVAVRSYLQKKSTL